MNARALLLGAALVAFASASAAQQAGTYRIGILAVGDQARLRDALRVMGYVEGRNVVYENRDSEGRTDRVDEAARELVRLKVDVIVATFPGAVFAAKRATTTIPIVMVNSPDPVQLGLVPSLAQPGGNITGTTSLSVDVSVKQLDYLREAFPRMSRVALLWNPDNPWHPLVVDALRKRSATGDVKLQMLPLQRPDEFDNAFRSAAAERADAIMVLADPMLMQPDNRKRLVALALEHRLPSMGGLRGWADAGGLMSYWADEGDLYRRVASYVDRILKGASPASLPIESPTKYELIVNLRTAKALGRTIPQPLLLRATVIE